MNVLGWSWREYMSTPKHVVRRAMFRAKVEVDFYAYKRGMQG